MDETADLGGDMVTPEQGLGDAFLAYQRALSASSTK
jgi:hypothetical protein